MVPGTLYQVTGSWFLVPGTVVRRRVDYVPVRYQVPGTSLSSRESKKKSFCMALVLKPGRHSGYAR